MPKVNLFREIIKAVFFVIVLGFMELGILVYQTDNLTKYIPEKWLYNICLFLELILILYHIVKIAVKRALDEFYNYRSFERD